MNKLERVSALLIKLQSRPWITAREIANHFVISIRTVYRDIQVLERAGVPVISHPGRGYSLMEGYKLPPLKFTPEEAIAFLYAEKIMNRETDLQNQYYFRSGMDKIRAGLGAVEKKIIENLENRIENIPSPEDRSKQQNILQPVLKSITLKKSLEIEYKSGYSGENTIREIEPVGLLYIHQNGYLAAYCLLRNQYRIFKLSRIVSLYEKNNDFTKEHPALQALSSSFYEDETFRIKLKVEKRIMPYIEKDKYLHGLAEETEKEKWVEQEYYTHSLDYFGRWFLSFADSAEILEPEELKEHIKGILAAIPL